MSHLKTPNNPFVEKLWQAAYDYEYQYISGSAIGLVTAGVLQSKPKCLAVAMWQKSIWDLYYQKKEEVLNGNRAAANQTFDHLGPIPYPVNELTEEIFPSA